MEFFSLKQFIKFKPFKIVQVDKNLGTCIMSNEIYNSYCYEHLNNNEYFISIPNNPIEELIVTISNTLNSLMDDKHLSSKLFNKCFINNPRLGKFRLLIKLHKPPKIGSRPIVNCINHITSNIAYIIDYILQPFVKESDSYLKDSQQLVAELNKLFILKKYDHYSFDIENLYLNLILKKVLDTITEFISDKLNTKYITTFGFYTILQIILFNNYFLYNKKYFLQIKGIAMGCKWQFQIESQLAQSQLIKFK